MDEVLMVYPSGFDEQGFPFGISILAAILKREGIAVRILDASASKLGSEALVRELVNSKPRVVCFTGMMFNFPFLKKVSLALKDRVPSVVQVAGGYWASPVPGIVFSQTKVDYVVLGEADLIIADLCKKLLLGKTAQGIQGVYSRMDQDKGFSLVCIPPMELDKLPTPAYELFDMGFYVWKAGPDQMLGWSIPEKKMFKGKRYINCATTYSGRGCYGRCTFCGSAKTFRRSHSPAYVIEHLRSMKERYDVGFFLFSEALTLATKNWAKDFAKALIKEGLDINYVAQCRGDFVYDNETIELLHESGCRSIIVGVESGSDEMLKRINKAVSVSHYTRLINDFQSNGILVNGSFILNMPGETILTMKNTLDFIKSSEVFVPVVGFASPYPKTELYDYAVKNGFIKDEAELVLTNPAKNKGRGDFDSYIKAFNFNDLPKKALLGTKKAIDRIKTINHYRYGNKVLYYLFKYLPFLISVRNIFELIKYICSYTKKFGIAKVAEKALSRLKLNIS